MADIVPWPHRLLVPHEIQANVVPFSRSGGTTLGGLQRVTRTDRGWWSIVYKGLVLTSAAHRRVFNALGTHCSGMAGLLAVPVWSHDTAAWPTGSAIPLTTHSDGTPFSDGSCYTQRAALVTAKGMALSTHSDGATFSDGSRYAQQAIVVETVDAVAIGATSTRLRLLRGIESLAGVRFSYQHALYKTGFPTFVDDDVWHLPVTPAIRAPIPAGAELEFALPTCLVRLASDREMDVNFSRGGVDRRDVAFVEAVDYWNDLAG